MKTYLVTCKGFEVIVQATSSGAAALEVMQRYGLFGVCAKPVTVQ